MRPVYVCVHCAAHYLPPEGMLYPTSGVAASPVHCASSTCTAAAVQAPPLPPALLAKIEERAQPAPQGRQNRRAARGRRAAAAPAGARTKLR